MGLSINSRSWSVARCVAPGLVDELEPPAPEDLEDLAGPLTLNHASTSR
jgi:hypothetical protein